MAPILTGATPEEIWPLIRAHHYSRRLPGNIQYCYAARKPGGLFGDTGDIEAGAIFSIPPTRWAEPVLELSRLVRVPLLEFPLSLLLSFSCDRLRRHGGPLVVSFADFTQGHHGGIYQAAGWNYAGKRERRMDGVMIDGVFHPGRSCNSRWNTRSPDKLRRIMPARTIEPHYDEGKYLYWRALSVAAKTRAKRLGLSINPYPKPTADSPFDAPVPTGESRENPPVSAPNIPRASMQAEAVR